MTRHLAIAVMLALCSAAVASDSLSDLEKQLQSDKPGIRQAAADKLGAMGPKAADAVNKLIDLLDDSPAVRSHAVIALGKIGDKAALPALDFMARDPLESVGVKKAARDAIEKMGPLADEEKDWIEECRKAIVVRGKKITLPKLDLAKRNVPLVRDGDYTIGDCGTMKNSRMVFQVLNDHDLLLKNSFGPPFFFHGFPTSGVAEDEYWITKEPVAVIGTSSYEDVLGSNRAVRIIIPFRMLKRPMTFEEFKELRESK